MTEESMMGLMADEAPAAATPPQAGIEMTFPLAAVTAAGENPGEENTPEEGDAVSIQLDATFVREENGQAVVRVTKANGEDVAAPTPEPSEDEAMEREGDALRQAAEKGGY